jgi:hypothetical protein
MSTANAPSWLAAAIADLAAIDANGQLSELLLAFAAECRAQGGSTAPDAERRERETSTMRPGAAVRARDVARAAAQLFGLPAAECERIARDVLLRDPWRDIALGLIDEYRPQSAPTATRQTWGQDGPEPTRRRAW